MRAVVTGLMLVGLTGLAQQASACLFGPTSFETSGAPGGQAPNQVGKVDVEVERGKAPQSSGCTTTTSSSCDDVGSIELRFETPTDPDSAADDVGYELTLLEGKPPSGLDLTPMLAFRDSGQTTPSRIWLRWLDGATDDQETIDFTITLTSVDRNGNRSAPSDPVRISNSEEDGCSIRGAGRRSSADLSWLFLGATLLWLARRRDA